VHCPSDLPFGTPVICLETQSDVCEHASIDVGHRSGVILIQCSESVGEIVSLARRIGPATLLSKLAFLSELPRQWVRTFWAGKLQVLVVLESKNDEELALPYIREGCSGVLHLDDSPELWQKAILSVAAGEMWASRRMLTRLLRELIRIENDPTRKITRRESEILELIGLGHDNRHIANELFISKETVRWHVRSLYSKIGVSDREGAIRFWHLSREEGST
jgi:DNA-binding NarL/FixJ family response regulator